MNESLFSSVLPMFSWLYANEPPASVVGELQPDDLKVKRPPKDARITKPGRLCLSKNRWYFPFNSETRRG